MLLENERLVGNCPVCEQDLTEKVNSYICLSLCLFHQPVKDSAPGEEGPSSKEKVVIAGAALGGGLLLLVLTITIIFVDFRFKR